MEKEARFYSCLWPGHFDSTSKNTQQYTVMKGKIESDCYKISNVSVTSEK